MKSIVTSLACLILLVSCETAGRGIDGFCMQAKPIFISKADVLTAETSRQVLAHNEFGAKKCGWKPS